MPRCSLRCLLVLLLAMTPAAKAADGDFAWAAEARALAPDGWLGGQVIGYDPATKTGVIALYPNGDGDPSTLGRALEVRLDDGGRPDRASVSARARRPTEQIYFQTNPYPSQPVDFEPAPNLPEGTTACAIGGWTHDADPDGVNLRAEASIKSRIVAKLPRLSNAYGIEFRIIGFKDGWFLIEKAEDPDYEQKAPKRQRIYTGRGWIAGRLVASSIASPDLLSSPHEDAGVVLKLSGTLGESSYGPDSVPIRRVLACKEGWTLIEAEDPPTRQRHTGWVRRLCSNQVTTCP